MQQQQIRAEIGAATIQRAQANAQAGLKNIWQFVCRGPRPEDRAAWNRLRLAARVARGAAVQALRQTGRDFINEQVVVTSRSRYWMWRAVGFLGGRVEDPAAALLLEYNRQLALLKAFPLIEKWADVIDNIVVNAGLNYLLDAGLSGGTQITSWYLSLLSATPTIAAGNTMASHAGWTEVVAYDESTRVAFVDGGVASQTCSNSASPAVFTISTDGTDVGGAFLTSGSAKSGTSGTLYAAGAFTAGNKSLDDGDTIDVTLTATAAAA